MNLYPLDLVLALAVAWGLIFLGRLPTKLLRLEVFYRQIGLAGLAWMVVAGLAPGSVLHFHIFIGLLCLFAWWRWREDHGLSGRLWLSVASGLGISLGVVLILAVTPGAWPVGALLPRQGLVLLGTYLGGAVVGLAYVLFVLTRRAATAADVPVGLVRDYARLLFWLTLGWAILAILRPEKSFWVVAMPAEVRLISVSTLSILILVPLAWWAWRRIRSPTPSRSGIPLLILCGLGMVGEIFAAI